MPSAPTSGRARTGKHRSRAFWNALRAFWTGFVLPLGPRAQVVLALLRHQLARQTGNITAEATTTALRDEVAPFSSCSIL
eukprot:7352648-Pyramimonas_sp.AAC.1